MEKAGTKRKRAETVVGYSGSAENPELSKVIKTGFILVLTVYR